MERCFLNYARRKQESGRKRERSIAKHASADAERHLITKRLLPYLDQAEIDRSERFLGKLITRTTQRYLRESLVHEGKHAADFEKDRWGFYKRWALNSAAGIISGGVALVLLHAVGVKDSTLRVLGSVLIGGHAVLSAERVLNLVDEIAVKRATEEIRRKSRWLDCVKFQVNEK